MDMPLEAAGTEKRAQILRGAAAVFAADGYEGASMARIAAVAGVSKGTLYNYYASKAALFTAHVTEACDRSLARIFDGVEQGNDPGAVLEGIGMRMLDMMTSDIGLAMYRVVISEAAKFPDLARGFFAAGPARATGFMAAWLEGQARLGLLSVPDPVFAAEQFFNLCQARVVLRRRLAMADAVPPGEAERVVRSAVAMFLRMYGPA